MRREGDEEIKSEKTKKKKRGRWTFFYDLYLSIHTSKFELSLLRLLNI
tara:strand:+ start:562 stop:705 length:144 start_codon:yes stop_codon:yes gene_type:complete